MIKTCSNCRESKPLSEFNFKNRSKGRLNASCKVCTRAQVRAAYYKNRPHYLEYRKKRNKEILESRREFLYKYLSKQSCIDCGIQDPVVLQFDHVRGEKLGTVSDMLLRKGSPMKLVLAEIAKCEIRCANCHARRTARQLGYYILKELSNLA